MRCLPLIAPLVVAVLVVGCGSGSSGGNRLGPAAQRQIHEEIHLYCGYGAVSRAQLDECQKHVTPGEIRALNTNAAEFARDRLDRCLGDSGPFCADAMRARDAADRASYYDSGF